MICRADTDALGAVAGVADSQWKVLAGIQSFGLKQAAHSHALMNYKCNSIYTQRMPPVFICMYRKRRRILRAFHFFPSPFREDHPCLPHRSGGMRCRLGKGPGHLSRFFASAFTLSAPVCPGLRVKFGDYDLNERIGRVAVVAPVPAVVFDIAVRIV